MNNAELILDIVNNPSRHIVNREEKMNRTLDVMAANRAKKEPQLEPQLERFNSEIGNYTERDEAKARGYGTRTGRKQGD